jgi:predicted DNA-binding transcriptional regulator AlpA
MPQEHSTTKEMTSGILGDRAVRQLTNLSRTTIWRLERQGKFPRRLRLSGNRIGWRAEEVLEWIESLPRGCAG